ncbi:MAG: hypothetical protein HFJ30_07905 [Clostridia bacterium]|nr:hypothetical protein [Clostridia bacterium]
MEKSVEVYGSVSISGCITKGVTEEFPINLEYYKICTRMPKNVEKPYGIGIVKTHEDSVETRMEKSEFNHIFSQEQEADKMLKLLIKNKVTPVTLRDILEDYATI